MTGTSIDEIASGIYRISTWVPDARLTFNQFLVVADEPLLFHTGPRGLFAAVSEAVHRVVPVDALRWVTFGHVESDECGSMNRWLAAAPAAEVAHGVIGCLVSLDDLADRPPRRLADGEVIDLGGRRVRHIDTPHVPHGWEARVLYEETTRTLLCGDLFTQSGEEPVLTSGDLVGPAMEAEALFRASSLAPSTPEVMRRLGDLEPTTLALMHGPSYQGDGRAALYDLAGAYEAEYALGSLDRA